MQENTGDQISVMVKVQCINMTGKSVKNLNCLMNEINYLTVNLQLASYLGR